MFPGVPVMRGSRAAVFALGAAAFTLTVLAFSALADVSETQRVDPGPPIQARVNEPFDVAPGGVWENATIDAVQFWWDLDNRTDSGPVEGNPLNDQDTFNLTFVHPGLPSVQTRAFTLWVNYSDGRLINASRVVTIVRNLPPVIDQPSPPSGIVDEPIAFIVTVNDPDSVESTLQYIWDFDIGTDSGTDAVLDNDVDSTAKTNISNAYHSEGTYTAKLTVRDDFGASAEAFITVVVSRPPGVCEVEKGDLGQYFTQNVTIRKQCWVSYRFHVTAGRLYQYDVAVSNDAPVYVMVQADKPQFDTYKLKSSQTAYVSEWSWVNAAATSIHMQFRPTQDGEIYVTVDNGYLFGLGSGRQADAVVTVQDVDRNNILANIPVWVWIVAAAVGIGVAGVFAGRAYIAGADVRRAEREKQAIDHQEKVSAKSELDQFLANPEAALQRKMAPPPSPVPPPGAPAARVEPAPAPGQPGPRAAPRPAGPQPPPGYVAPPPPPPRPTPPSATGPQPPPQTDTQAPAPMACPACGTPSEAGWTACPNCGGPL